MKCTIIDSVADFDEWYYNCHVKRIIELNGKIWDYDILRKIVFDGQGNLAVVKNYDNIILGGCVFLKSSIVLEFFMMSTPKNNLINGVNYFLTEWLYIYAYDQNLKYINWQASNPPIGPLVDYKKGWNANIYNFNIYNINFNDSLDQNFIETHFKDCYIFPFSQLKN